MVIIDSLIDFVVDYYLILFIPEVQEDTALVPAFSFPHEVFTVLNRAEENSQPRTQVRKSLNKKIITIKDNAADFSLLYVT